MTGCSNLSSHRSSLSPSSSATWRLELGRGLLVQSSPSSTRHTVTTSMPSCVDNGLMPLRLYKESTSSRPRSKLSIQESTRSMTSSRNVLSSTSWAILEMTWKDTSTIAQAACLLRLRDLNRLTSSHSWTQFLPLLSLRSTNLLKTQSSANEFCRRHLNQPLLASAQERWSTWTTPSFQSWLKKSIEEAKSSRTWVLPKKARCFH